MTLALLYTVTSAVCMALMVITDRIMVGDCYDRRPNHAWFVSSVAGSIFGLILTILVWSAAVTFGNVESVESIIRSMADLFLWRGVAMMITGALAIQVLLHYFRCFREEASSAAIAAWLAATPIFIFVSIIFLQFIVPSLKFSDASYYDSTWILGVALASIGLILFERLAEKGPKRVGKYRRELLLMMGFNVIYIITLRQILSQSTARTDGLTEILALMPFYWIGFAAGIRILLFKKERTQLRIAWLKRIKFFFIPILITEVIGMLVFFFEYLGLTELDPTYVNIIISAHIFLVWYFNLLLSHMRKSMKEKGIYKFKLGSMWILRQRLPLQNGDRKQRILEFAAMTIAVIGIVLASG